LWEKFASPCAFTQWAASDDFWKKEWSATFLPGQAGVGHWTKFKFTQFCETLPGQAAVAFAELLFGIMTTVFDMACVNHVTSHPEGGATDYDSLIQFLRKPTDDAHGLLTDAFKKYTTCLAGQAVALDADELSQPLAAGSQAYVDLGGPEDDPDQGEKHQIYEKIMADKAGRIRFHAFPASPAGPHTNYSSTTELNKILAGCPFHANRGPTEKVKTRAWLVSADLFPGCMTAGFNDYRLPHKYFMDQEVPAEMRSLWKWIVSVKRPDDLIVIFDGRFPRVRRYFDKEVSDLGPNNLVEMWIIYEMPEPDPRYPTKKFAYSNSNRETCLIYRPPQKKTVVCKPRQSFNACGEKSIHDMTYSLVALRNLGELPKLTPGDKQKMMGTAVQIPESYPGTDNSLAADGVPLAWAESKSVSFWVSFYQDLGIEHIFDCTTGSAAAAMAAFHTNAQYDGICSNPLHKTWCAKLLNQVLFAVVAEGGTCAKDEFVQKVLSYFGPAVDEGIRLIKQQEKEAKGMKNNNPNPPEQEPAPEPDAPWQDPDDPDIWG